MKALAFGLFWMLIGPTTVAFGTGAFVWLFVDASITPPRAAVVGILGFFFVLMGLLITVMVALDINDAWEAGEAKRSGPHG